MIQFIKAGIVCQSCGQKFWQIDTDEARALEVVRTALTAHVAAEHPDPIEHVAGVL